MPSIYLLAPRFLWGVQHNLTVYFSPFVISNTNRKLFPTFVIIHVYLNSDVASILLSEFLKMVFKFELSVSKMNHHKF